MQITENLSAVRVLLCIALVLAPHLVSSGQAPTTSPLPRLAHRPILNSRHMRPGGVPATSASSSGPILFNPPNFLSGGVYGFSVAVADFNGDGKPDLAIANECLNVSCTTGSVSVLLGNGDGTFQAAQSYASGGYEATSVAVGDVNGDGKPDLVVANGCQSDTECTNGVVGVLLGNGDGTFQAAQTFSSGGVSASSVAIADVNKDGNLDLAVANECLNSACTSGSVSILLGNGNGTFQTALPNASGGVTAVSVAIADFNNDTDPDLAVVNQCASATSCSGSVGILLGTGTGTFAAAVTYSSGGYNAASVATGDFNSDGNIDLAVANNCQTSTNCAGNVGVLLGTGTGTFQTPKSYGAGGGDSSAVVVSDVNGDGQPDIILANQCQIPSDCIYGSVSVLLGNSNGTFQTAQTYLSDGVFAYALYAEDLNGDGNPDLAVVNQCQNGASCSGTVTVLLGNGNGTFQEPPTYGTAGVQPDAVAVGDVNGDGNPDLVVANSCESNCGSNSEGLVMVLLGNGTGTFTPGAKYPTGGYKSSSVAIADVNGDGKPDIVVANRCSTSNCESGGSVSVLLGNGNGTFQAAQTFASGGDTSLSVAIADFNADGNLDLAVANECQDSSCANGSVTILLGNGNGTFQTAQVFASGGYETDSVAVGDFNGDGIPDLVLANQCQDSTCQNGSVSVLLGNGNGTFQTASSYSSGAAQANSVALTDLNGDGNTDLVVSNLCESASDCGSGAVSSLLGTGIGTFHTAHVFGSGGQDAYSVVAADFNGDGFPDVVVTNSTGTCVLLGTGTGQFRTALPYYPGGNFVATSDFNGDGKPDVAVVEEEVSKVAILLNVTQGFRYATSTTLTSSINPSSVYQTMTFTSTVTPGFPGSPTGTVTFKSGSTTLGIVTLSGGQAVLNYAFTTPATYSVTASYSGDTNYLPSASSVLKQKVVEESSTTTLTSSLNPSQVGQSVTFTAKVAGQYGGTPTGTVTFRDNGTVVATVSLSNGVAKYKTSTLPEGTDRINADYAGNTECFPSTAKLYQVVE
jgi:hypothetical protein